MAVAKTTKKAVTKTAKCASNSVQTDTLYDAYVVDLEDGQAVRCLKNCPLSRVITLMNQWDSEDSIIIPWPQCAECYPQAVLIED